jgi:hypothetical protein
MAETEEAWDAKARSLLKAELNRQNVTYGELVERLAAIGVKETKPNIRNKLAWGKLTAVFLLQVLQVIGITTLRLEE